MEWLINKYLVYSQEKLLGAIKIGCGPKYYSKFIYKYFIKWFFDLINN